MVVNNSLLKFSSVSVTPTAIQNNYFKNKWWNCDGINSYIRKIFQQFLKNYCHVLALKKLFLDTGYLVKRGPMISPLSIYQYVSMSVDKLIFFKMAYRIFLKLLMKLGWYKGKKLTARFGKKSHFWNNVEKHPQNSINMGSNSAP